MTDFNFYVQKAIDLGLVKIDDKGQFHPNADGAVHAISQAARIIDKLQPSTVNSLENTTDQEAIVLSRVLSSDSGKAKEFWSKLRSCLGVSLTDNVFLLTCGVISPSSKLLVRSIIYSWVKEILNF